MNPTQQEASCRCGHPLLLAVPPGALQPVAHPRLPEQQEDPDHPHQWSGPIGKLWRGRWWRHLLFSGCPDSTQPSSVVAFCSCWQCRTCSQRGTSLTWCSPPSWSCRSSTHQKTRSWISTWCLPSARLLLYWAWCVCVLGGGKNVSGLFPVEFYVQLLPPVACALLLNMLPGQSHRRARVPPAGDDPSQHPPAQPHGGPARPLVCVGVRPAGRHGQTAHPHSLRVPPVQPQGYRPVSAAHFSLPSSSSHFGCVYPQLTAMTKVIDCRTERVKIVSIHKLVRESASVLHQACF